MESDVFPRQFRVDEAPAWSSTKHGSDETTQGVRVQVEPRYMPEHSEPAGEDGAVGVVGAGRWVWAYRVRVSNVGEAAATLVDRHWTISDGDGERHDVDGPGVVGHRPRLAPSQAFEYESFCPLPTCWGTMEGWYRFQRDPIGSSAGDEFRVRIGRFYLATSHVGLS